MHEMPTIQSFRLDAHSKIPLHQQVRSELHRILDQEFSPGDRFYSENVLTRKFAVSRITIRRALADLAREGRIVSQAGRRTIVSSPRRPADDYFLRERSFASGQADASDKTLRSRIRLIRSAQGKASEYCNELTNLLAEGAADLGSTFEITVVKGRGSLDAAMEQICESPVDESMILFVGGLSATIHYALLDRGYNVVSLDSMSAVHSGAIVSTDHRAAVTIGLEHLFDFGHRSIVLLVNEPVRDPSVHSKIEQFYLGMREAGNANTARVVICDTGYEPDGHDRHVIERMEEVWPEEPSKRPTAIFTVSDPGGWAAMKWLAARGVRIPEDVSVLGFEGASSSAFLHPAMSTVAHPLNDIVKTTFALLKSEHPVRHMSLVRPILIARESTGPACTQLKLIEGTQI